MKAHADSGISPPSTGFYPWKELPLRMGFPSTLHFQTVHNARGEAIAVTALREFHRFSRICRVSGHLLPYRCRHTRQMSADVHVYDPRFCGLLNHACEPNSYLDMSEMWLWAVDDIKAGDLLTIDLAATEETLQRQFACRCDSSLCRGWIFGYAEEPNANGQQFFSHWHRPNG